MSFSGKQVQALRRKLDGRQIRTREANGRELAYIEGWFAISEANRIFGFDGWSRETLEARCVLTRENRGTFVAVYTAKVRITVKATGTTGVSVMGMDLAKAEATLLAKSTTSRSKPQKRMAPNALLRHLVGLLASNFTGKTGRRLTPCYQRRHRRLCSRRPLASVQMIPPPIPRQSRSDGHRQSPPLHKEICKTRTAFSFDRGRTAQRAGVRARQNR